MRALEKERSRRYESASRFAEDIERFLKGEAVEACPPSTAYRFRKFVRRNRLLVISAAAVLVALLTGITGTSVGLLSRQTRGEASGGCPGRDGDTA